ncbi:hypothetical protein [Nonomuraea jabiensis]|uniref:hypothetical protein n=1 Tax=Nonomuraea jabiensis TaxID=882448 RepID=UPI0036A61306
MIAEGRQTGFTTAAPEGGGLPAEVRNAPTVTRGWRWRWGSAPLSCRWWPTACR